MRHSLVLFTILLVTVVGLFSCQSVPPEEKVSQKPNILFIFAPIIKIVGYYSPLTLQ